MQLEGKKKWSLVETFKQLPSTYSPDFELEKLKGRKEEQILLEAGDLLYFPRGTIHSASSLPSLPSHHLTLSTFQNNNFKEFLINLLQNSLNEAFLDDLSFRQGLPINYSSFLGASHFSPLPSLPSSSLQTNQNPNFGEMELHAFDQTSKQEKENKRKLFMEKVKQLYKKLENFFDVDKVADEMSLDFIVHRLPPLPPSSIPPHPPLLQDEEESESGENEEERKEEKKEEMSKLWELAPNSDNNKVRIVSLDCFRVTGEIVANPLSSFNGEEEEKSIEVYTSLHNSTSSHMTGTDTPPVCVTFPSSYAQAIQFLRQSFPKFIKIKSLPLKQPDDRLSLCIGLWKIGILEIFTN